MRTLQTQMLLRRVLRVEGEYHRRLVQEGGSGQLAEAASARLLQLLRDTGAGWSRESAGAELGGLGSHVSRSLSAMAAAAAGLAQPGASRTTLSERFHEAGIPLLFFLRGLDDSSEPVLAELAGAPLRRSA